MKKIKVFIVDDSRTFIEGLESYFKYSEDIIVVDVAQSGQECLEKIKNISVDIILMDIKMETAKAGILATKSIKAQELTDAKIIFLTSEYNKADIQKALMMNCSFIDKSCSVSFLITIIKRVFFKQKLIVDI